MGRFFFARSYLSLVGKTAVRPAQEPNHRFRDTQELKGSTDDAQHQDPVEIPMLKHNILGSSLQPVVESYDEFE